MKPFKPALVIHGGAGTINRSSLSKQQEQYYLKALSTILRAGQKELEQGRKAVDIVTEAVVMLEDNPLFNAGKGAVLTAKGTHELDASIMDGQSLETGAIAGVKHIKNPILLAKMVMTKSPHVLLISDGAEAFAKKEGIPMVEANYFTTPLRIQQLEAAQAADKGAILDHTDLEPSQQLQPPTPPLDEKDKMGTVGAVALDSEGNLASATSTGGLTNKEYGRVGDSPIIGAGCYANDQTCAVSCTGKGEAFIRAVAAYDVSALMAYRHLSLLKAAKTVIHQKLPPLGGAGGLIAIDALGNIAMPFNTEGMYRGYAIAHGEVSAAIYGDDDGDGA